MRKKIRIILWLFIFLSGAAASLFYIQGWRVDPETGEIIPTGIIDISTSPEEGTLIFIDGELRGESPQIIRGFPLGQVDVKIEKSGYDSVDAKLFVEREFVTKIQNLQLIPLYPKEALRVIGDDDEIIMDANFQGFVRILAGLKAIAVYDFQKGEAIAYELPEEPVSVEFRDEGKIIVRFSDADPWEETVFPTSLFSSRESEIAESVISPEGETLVFARGRYLYLKNLKNETIQEVLVEGVPILGVWWLPESDDILAVTNTEIFLWNRFFEEKREYLKMANVDTAFFYPLEKRLILHEDGKWKSLVIGE